jgi:hypothetical protein
VIGGSGREGFSKTLHDWPTDMILIYVDHVAQECLPVNRRPGTAFLDVMSTQETTSIVPDDKKKKKKNRERDKTNEKWLGDDLF